MLVKIQIQPIRRKVVLIPSQEMSEFHEKNDYALFSDLDQISTQDTVREKANILGGSQVNSKHLVKSPWKKNIHIHELWRRLVKGTDLRTLQSFANLKIKERGHLPA